MLRSAAAVMVALSLTLFASPASATARRVADSDHDGLTNRFERTLSHTDPHRADSNGDGVPDSAEDPDGDSLSNLGEQRFGTDPWKADTDGNGIPDGAEDTDHDGTSNAQAQDDRPLPKGLRPALRDARMDLPAPYLDGCNVLLTETQYHHCNYGDPKATIRVALYGDSHAAQWFPALRAVTRARGWRLDLYTRSGCPSVDVASDANCTAYRQQAIAAMAADPPSLVIVTNRIGYAGLADRQAGLARTLNALPAGTIRLVLEDTPLPDTIDVPPCLKAHRTDMAACEGAASVWINQQLADMERSTAEANGASFANLNPLICPYDPCGVVFGTVLAYRDWSHLTATFARRLAPSMGRLLDGFLTP